jgi:hypothetical protein
MLSKLETHFRTQEIVSAIDRFSQNDGFKALVIEHAPVLLCRSLISDDYFVRDATERAIPALFDLLPLRPKERAEFLLRHPGRLAPIDATPSVDPPQIEVDDCDADAFAQLTSDLCRCCRESAESLNELLENDSEPQIRFTSLLRSLRLALSRSDASDPSLADSVFDLFVAVANSPARGGCNLCEFIRLFEQLPEEERALLITGHSDTFLRCIFPITFTAELGLSAITFIEAVRLISFLPEVQSSDVFRDSYRQFLALPLRNQAYVWTIARMTNMVGRDQENNRSVAQLVVSLIEEDLPISAIPVIVAADLPLGEQAFKWLLDATVRACDEKVSKPGVGKFIFNSADRLFSILEEHLKKFPDVPAPIPPLLSAYLSPSGSKYATALQSFLLRLAEHNAAVRKDALESLISWKDDVEQDGRVVWRWLAIRLRLCENEEDRETCLNDAVSAADKFEGAYGLAFVLAVLDVYGDRRDIPTLRRFIAEVKRVGIWEADAVAEILVEVESSGDVLKGFRTIQDLIDE